MFLKLGEDINYGLDCVGGWNAEALFDTMAEKGNFICYGMLSGISL